MRIGILGAGDMGATHARIFAAVPDVEIAGVVGRTPERAERLAAELGIPSFAEPWPLLDDPTIDAIDVTTPSAVHREWTVAALERGKHVLCETPMALTLEDADAMIVAAGRSGTILMPAQVHRFGVEYAFLHDEVASGRLGRPLAVYGASRLPPYGSGVRRPIDLYGGPLLDLMIHPFDCLNWLLGVPRSVAATGVTGPSGTIDYAFAALAFDGAAGMVEGSAMMPAGFPFTMSLRAVCEDGAIEAYGRLGPQEEFGVSRYEADGEPEEIRLEGDDPYTRECRYFIGCIRGEEDPAVVSPRGERAALAVALAAQQSIDLGQTVALR